MAACGPIMSQQVVVATVKDSSGKPLAGKRVEWMIPPGEPGVIVQADGRDGKKVDNSYAITETVGSQKVIRRGAAGDITIGKGQTYVVLTSPNEGMTHLIAFAPGIKEWGRHKAIAVAAWQDVCFQFPPVATNPAGTPHTLKTRVAKFTDGSPLAGWQVTYTVVSGPEATFEQGGGKTATVTTDAQGYATVVLKQTKPTEGVNDIDVQIGKAAKAPTTQPTMPGCGLPVPPDCMAMCRTRKTWVAPKLALCKTAAARAEINQQISYTLTVSNSGSMEATNVKVTDNVPDGLQYVSSNPGGEASGQTVTWQLGTLPAGGQKSVTVLAKATKAGDLCNPAVAVADMGLDSKAQACTTITTPALAVIQAAPACWLACECVTIKNVVTNTGQATAYNVQGQTQLPAGLTTADGKTTVPANFGNLAPGQSKEQLIQVKTDRAGTFTSRVGVSADGGLTADASSNTTAKQPVLLVTGSAPETRFIGKQVRYDFTVTNRGDIVATGTKLAVTLPKGATFNSGSEGVKADGARLMWDLGNLDCGASKGVCFVVTPTCAGDLTADACATAACAAATGQATSKIQAVSGILMEVVDCDDPLEVGCSETYTITVTNQGNVQDTNIRVWATLPAEMKFVSATGATKEKVDGQTVTFDPINTLGGKQTVTYKIVAKASAAGDARIKVALQSDQIKTPVEKNESTTLYK